VFISPALSTHSLGMPSSRPILIAAGLSGFLAVALGAFGAHALKQELADRGMTSAWETAVLYHLVHSVALLAVGLAGESLGRARGGVAACWTAGIVLFSGSLYALALGAPRFLGPVTPVGGGALLVGWAWLAVAAWRRPAP